MLDEKTDGTRLALAAVRAFLNRVLAAEQDAQANLIRRREGVAEHCQADADKAGLVGGKEQETLEKLTAKVKDC